MSAGRLLVSAAAPVVLSLALAGCVHEILGAEPDLGALYGRRATEAPAERNPVIVIPGLTGSRLVETETGRVVWGDFSGDYARPGRPADARLIALPMAEGSALRELRDGVRSDGVIDRLRLSVVGIPIHLRAYYYILEALGAGGYVEDAPLASTAGELAGERLTCFQFDYDWRRDNVENARRLGQFIEEKRTWLQAESVRTGRPRAEFKFDVVAHSMGALLLRYYLRFGAADLPEDGSLPPVTWAGAADVERAVLIAPPNAGTLESLVQLVDGKGYGPFATYSPVLLGTFPSGYQMLPRGRHAMVLEAGGPVADLFDPELWRRMGWGLASPEADEMLGWLLPQEEDPLARRRIALDHQAKALRRAGRFTAALDQPAAPPDGLSLFLVAGDATPTARRMEVGGDREPLAVLESEPGDGKVLRRSALMDERLAGTAALHLSSPIAWRGVLFLPQGHLDLTKDPLFTDHLLFWLLDLPPAASSAAHPSG